MSRRAGWKRPVMLHSLLSAGLLFAAASVALAANPPAHRPASKVQPNTPNKRNVPKVVRQKAPVNNTQDGSGTDDANRGTPPAAGGKPGPNARTESVGKDETIAVHDAATPPGGTTVMPAGPDARPGGASQGTPAYGQGK